MCGKLMRCARPWICAHKKATYWAVEPINILACERIGLFPSRVQIGRRFQSYQDGGRREEIKNLRDIIGRKKKVWLSVSEFGISPSSLVSASSIPRSLFISSWKVVPIIFCASETATTGWGFFSSLSGLCEISKVFLPSVSQPSSSS